MEMETGLLEGYRRRQVYISYIYTPYLLVYRKLTSEEEDSK